MKKRMTKEMEGWLFIGPAMIFLAVMYLFPLFNALTLSFTLDGAWNGVQNYVNVLSDRIFWLNFSNTVIFTLINVTAHLLIGLVTALLLNYQINQKVANFFRGLLMIPWLIATVVAAGIWILIYHPIGILNHYLMRLGLMQEHLAWLGEPNLALYSVVFVNIWKYYPLMMVFILSGLKAIPKEHYEAARMDGARPYQTFFHITLPGIRSIVIFITLLDAVWAFRHFDFVYLMTGGGPMFRSEVLTVYTYRVTFQGMRFNYGASIANIMLVFTLVVSALYLRLHKEGD